MRLKLKKREGNGAAYALLNFESEKEISDIESELLHIDKNKQKYNIHPELYIYAVKTSPSDVHTDLKNHNAGEYILKAILPGATNEDAAKELSHAANQIYQALKPSGIEAGYEKHDKFHYEDKGKYHHLRKKDKLDDIKE